MTLHITRFFRCTDEAGLYRAVCTCGWSVQGDLDYIQGRTATHDLDDISEPAEKISGFVSVLSNIKPGE